MNDARGHQIPEATACAGRSQERPFALVDSADLPPGDCYVAIVEPDGSKRVRGLFDAATGNVFACESEMDPRPPCPSLSPIVRIVGTLDGQTGQVTVLQQDGSYRRFSRWDRIDQGSPAQPDAIIRTLPQCGCGGSLGMPKLFDSFAEMSAYFFCTFGLQPDD